MLIAVVDNEKPLWVCHYSILNIQDVEINNISLLEAIQGKRIGSKLLKYTINHIFDNGMDITSLY